MQNLFFPYPPNPDLLFSKGNHKTDITETFCSHLMFPSQLVAKSILGKPIKSVDRPPSFPRYFLCLEQFEIYGKTERKVQRCPIHPLPPNMHRKGQGQGNGDGDWGAGKRLERERHLLRSWKKEKLTIVK